MPFSPSDISGLKIWLKADAGAGSSDNDPVGTWTDQSGTSHNFTGSGASRPTYKTNIQNGLPVVRFDGSDDEMGGGDLSAVFSSAGSMVCAVNPTGSNGKVMVYKTKNNDEHWRFTSGEGYWGVFRSTRLSNTPTSGLPETGWHIWSVTANGTAYKMWLDQVNKINAGSFTFDGGNNHQLASQESFSYHQAMDLGELIVYDSVLSDADRESVENYLGARWAITLPNATATPSTVAAVATVPAPTVLVPDANVFPSTVAATATVPAPTVTGIAVATPSTVASVATVPAPTIQSNQIVAPSTVAAVATVPAPTVVVIKNITVTPSTVLMRVRIPDPFITGTGPITGGGTGSDISVLWTIELRDPDG